MNFKVTIVSRNEKWEQDCQYLRLPCSEGELTILYNHSPIMGKLYEGEIVAGGYTKRIKEGFFEFKDNQARVVINAE